MGPTSRAKIGHKTAPRTWAPTVGAHTLRRKMGPFLGSWFLGTRFRPFFAAPSEAKQTHGVQNISPGAHQDALVKDMRVQMILNHRRNIFINVFLTRVGCPGTLHWQCLLMTTTPNSHQSAAYDTTNVRSKRTQLH